MVFMHGYLLVGFSLEKLVWSRHIVITGGGIAAESLVASAGSLFYFFFFLYFCYVHAFSSYYVIAM
jgi:hypothetical protein